MSAVKFTVNGKEYKVNSSIEADTSLNSYLRNYANLRGTKAMCHEGGCGVCIVAAKIIHPVTKVPEVLAVNSCLVSVLSCHGWEITTIEGIGDKNKGYHKIQSRLASFNGTQCGYCSPGWVMNMFSLMEENTSGLTMKEVENSFAGNICRCTGYRPILDAFKSFSKDADPALLQKVMDIEEMANLKLCAKTGSICTRTCDDYSEDGFCVAKMDKPLDNNLLKWKADETLWYKVYKIKDIFDIFQKEGTDSYMLVAGNTAQGVYHMKSLPKVMIDITSVAELRKHMIDASLVLGASMTLNEIMEVFQDASQKYQYFEYTSQMYHHMDLIAHIPVRNIGTIAGNLSIKHQHNEFQSDMFLLLEAVGATMTILESPDKSINISPEKYLKLNMKGKIIYSINLPPMSSDYIFHSYKIMPRAQNAHAHVNAGFVLKFKSDKKTIEKASIVYGGINPEFIHASATENFLTNKNIFNKNVLKLAIQSLADEIFPDINPPEPSPEYRKKLAIGLFYKFLLHINPSNEINPLFKSGGDEFDRPVSSAKQEFDTNKDIWPLNQPIPKIEAVTQCSGEAVYMNDLATLPNEAYAAFVLSTVCNGMIDTIDTKSILAEKGVIAVFTAKDIPGKNNFTPNIMYLPEIEEVVSSGKILFYGQPVAILVAETERLAKLMAEKVKVTYKNVSTNPPILSIREAIKSPSAKDRIVLNQEVKAKSKGTNVKKVIKGSFDIYSQYHYTMETQTCVCVPIEDGLDVYPATQWMDLCNVAIAETLNIPVNSINIKVRRLGGAYGGKITRSSQISIACALSAHLLNRPVRFVLPFETNMLSVGKRLPCSNDYEVGVDDKGKIQYLINTFYEDNGCSHNETIATFTVGALKNCYDISTWSIKANSVKTDTPSNTWCRAPATTEGIAMTENIMEHIATEIGLDPLEVRLNNINEDKNPLLNLIDDFKKSTDYEKRSNEILEFNKSNRWRKRGIHLTPMQYSLDYFGNFASLVSVYHGDGTISVSHAGIEMGQGINTKVAQVCAHTLGVSLDMISVKPSSNLTAPNAIVSGGSVASESCCYATIKACEILLERLEPIKKSLKNPTWPELIKKAFFSGVDLCAHHMFTVLDGVKPYEIYGVTIVEVEIDMLTGNHQVLRVDILEDTGESLSPEVDIGQIEGSYIMGLGYWTSEHLMYDPKTGQLLTHRTWTYKPPGIKDIPIDFRIQFRRNSPNPAGVLRSKATGEPPLCMSVGIIFAMRQAITSARTDNGLPANEWYNIDMPLTTENIIHATNTKIDDFTY